MGRVVGGDMVLGCVDEDEIFQGCLRAILLMLLFVLADRRFAFRFVIVSSFHHVSPAKQIYQHQQEDSNKQWSLFLTCASRSHSSSQVAP